MSDISASVQRFLGKFVFHLNKERRKPLDTLGRINERHTLSSGHPITTHYNFGGVDFYLLWHGEQKWTIKNDLWTLRSQIMEVQMSGDEQAFTRDLTMLMMAAELDE